MWHAWSIFAYTSGAKLENQDYRDTAWFEKYGFPFTCFFSFALTTCRFEKKRRRRLKNERKVVENREKKVGKNMALVHKHTSVRFSFLNTPLYLPGVAIFVEIFLVLFSQLVCFFLQYFWLLGDAGMKKRLGMIQKV